MSGAFDPRDHVIQLRQRSGGYADYLPVAARLAWFRESHPDGVVVIDAHAITEQVAIFRARVSVSGGGAADGWGSETPDDFKDYIEKASTKALGRALAALGFGTMEGAEELDRGERGPRPVDTPVPTPVDAVAAVLADLAEWDADDQPFAALRAYGEDAAGRLGARGGQRIRAALAAIAERRRAVQRVS